VTVDGGTKNNHLSGSALNDVFRITAETFDSDDQIKGGGHESKAIFAELDNLRGDVLELQSDAKSMTVIDAQFGGVSAIDTLALSGKAGFNLILGGTTDAAGISIVDASAATGAVKIDTRPSGQAQTVLFNSKGLTAADTVLGDGNTTLGITDKAALTDAALKQVTGVANLTVFGDAGTADYSGAKVQIGLLSSAAGIELVTNATNYGLTLDASARTDGFRFQGSIGDDVLIAPNVPTAGVEFDGGAGDDSLQIDANDILVSIEHAHQPPPPPPAPW